MSKTQETWLLVILTVALSVVLYREWWPGGFLVGIPWGIVYARSFRN